ncbi:MAG: site-specific integrase [Myxococcales bacterium]|nr:site-specific integrase [Myxococcales bacterium]
MCIRRDPRNGGWFFRATVKRADGKKVRIYGTPGVPGPYQDLSNTKVGAQAAEDRAKAHALTGTVPAGVALVTSAAEEEVPTFAVWFKGRFWREWVVGRKNKPSEVRSKEFIYDCHLEDWFGPMRLDRIGTGEVAGFRAELVEKGLSEKRINNILAVLSKPLKYAVECDVIAKAPRIGLFKVERPEIVAWSFGEYSRLLHAASNDADEWNAAVCLAGEAGLRVGEVKALRWREDVDMIARTITVNVQSCNGVQTTPKGRTRRTIPMTTHLYQALKRLSVVREGLVVRSFGGDGYTDSQFDKQLRRICRRAGLPVRAWHTLRHTFGTHAAMFGVNPWRLQAWMGHKRIDETMLYVHVAEAHMRDLPDVVRDRGDAERDPDRRVLAMLGARGSVVAATRTEIDQERTIAVC